MIDRIPTKPGRIKLTDEQGNVKYYTMERADEPLEEGTPLNKATLLSDDTSKYVFGNFADHTVSEAISEVNFRARSGKGGGVFGSFCWDAKI